MGNVGCYHVKASVPAASYFIGGVLYTHATLCNTHHSLSLIAVHTLYIISRYLLTTKNTSKVHIPTYIPFLLNTLHIGFEHIEGEEKLFGLTFSTVAPLIHILHVWDMQKSCLLGNFL